MQCSSGWTETADPLALASQMFIQSYVYFLMLIVININIENVLCPMGKHDCIFTFTVFGYLVLFGPGAIRPEV